MCTFPNNGCNLKGSTIVNAKEIKKNHHPFFNKSIAFYMKLCNISGKRGTLIFKQEYYKQEHFTQCIKIFIKYSHLFEGKIISASSIKNNSFFLWKDSFDY